jgi:7-cyano-7-deazaguanine reductase
MARKKSLKNRYRRLDRLVKIPAEGEKAIRSDALITFPYRYPGQPEEVTIDTEEFTALCPWTGLPDSGRLEIRYLPGRLLLELKSLKYYLLSFRSVGIVQEHAAARILRDLVKALQPRRLEVVLDYRPRGGLHTTVRVFWPEGDRKQS